MKFINSFKKDIAKIEGIVCDSVPPTYWTSSGCYALNKILGGTFNKAFGQGRIVGLVGPSGCLPGDEQVLVYRMKSVTGVTPIVDE